MKADTMEVLRRALENTFANWPAMLLRLAGSVVIFAVAALAILAMIVPTAIWIGLSLSRPDSWRNVDPTRLGAAFLDHLLFVAGALIFLTVVFTLLVAIYSFLESAMARLMYDGELAAAAAEASGNRAPSRFRVFSVERFFAAGKAFWWRVFLVYNVIWGVACAIVLIPLLVILALLYSMKGSPAALGLGCLLLGSTLAFMILLAVVANAWAKKAIMIVVATGVRGVEATRLAWREFRGDAARHVLVVVVLIALSLALSAVISSLSMGAVFSQHVLRQSSLDLLFAPLRIATSVLNGIVGLVITTLYIAAFAALQRDRGV